MPLPQPSGFPTPTAFPPPQPDPMFGATPDELRTMQFAGLSPGLPTTTQTAPATTAAAATTLTTIGSVTGNAVGPTNDPHQWTPDQAAEQSNTAIAKIATVNTDLAARLQAERSGQPDTGGGFFDALKHGVAEIAGLPGISQVMDWMSRPAKIIPELLDDKEGQSVWGNVAQALAGNSTASWHRVLTDKFGIDGPLAAVLGFVGDVATDPTTYLMAGLGGVGREVALRVAGEAGFRATEGVGAVVTRIAAESGVEESQVVRNLYHTVTGVTDDVLKTGAHDAAGVAADALKAGSVVHPDAAGNVMSIVLRDGEQKALLEGARAADSAIKYASEGGLFNSRSVFGHSLGMSEQMGAELGVDPNKILSVLEDMRKAGAGGDKIAYEAAKAAAGLQGGLRFKFSLPVFNLRYISPAIPFSNRVGFQIGRRFFSGMSGGQKLMHLVDQNVPGAAEAMQTFWNPVKGLGGFSGVKRLHPEIAARLSKGAFHFGGALFPLSEQMGRLTAHFAPTASLMRGGGLGAQMAIDAKRAAGDMRNSFYADAFTLADSGGTKGYGQPEAAQALAKGAGTDADYAHYLATGERGTLTDEEVKAVDYYKAVQHSAETAGNLHGVMPRNVDATYEDASALHPVDVAGYEAGNHAEVAGREWHIVGDPQGQDLPHVDEGLVGTADEVEGGRGILLEEGSGGAGQATVAARNPLILDARTEGANLTPSVNPIDEYKANADGAVAVGHQGIVNNELDPGMVPLKEEEVRAHAISEQAKASGYDSILRIDEDGTHHLTMLDHSNVKRISADATRVGPAAGGMPVVLSDEVRNALRGVMNTDQLKYVSGTHAFEAQLAREAAGKTPAEVQDLVRKLLKEHNIELPEGTKLLETDLNKVTSHYVRGLAEASVDSMLGRMSRKLEHMGFGGRYDLGALAQHRPARWAPTDATLDKLGRKAQEARDRLAKRQATADATKARLHQVAQMSQNLAREREALEEGIRGAEQGLVRTAARGPDAAVIDAATARTIGEASDPYMYHVTTDSAVGHISDEGVRTYLPDESGKVSWNHGATDSRSWWADQPPTPGNGRDRIIRTLRDESNFHDEEGTANSFLNDHLPVSKVEYYGTDGEWHAMSERSPGYQDDLFGARGDQARLAEVKKQMKQREREVRDLQAKYERQTDWVNVALNEHNKIQAATHVSQAQVMPALRTDAGNLAGFAPVAIPGLEGHYMPAFMAAELNQAARGFRHLSDFQATWRQFTGVWKTWATWMNPGFHLRNVQGAWFNNFLGGVSLRHHIEAIRIRKAASEIADGVEGGRYATRAVSKDLLRKTGIDAHFSHLDRPVNYGDLAGMVDKAGVTSANSRSFSEAFLATEDAAKELGRRHWIEKGPLGFLGRRYVRRARQAGDLTENVFRSAAWLKGMETTGGDIMGARAFTMMRHGDYSELTDWEYGFVRDLIPFYKWTRTNLPYQIHTLLESPGKLTAVLHAQEAGYNAVGIDFDKAMQDMPPWMRDQFSLPVPGGKDGAFNVITADLPMSDLHKSGTEFLSSFLPTIKPFLESYVYGKSTFTGADITNKGVPFSLGNIPVVRDVLSAAGIGQLDSKGQLTVSEKLQNVLSVIPVFSRFRDFIYQDPSRAGLRANTVASALFGVGLRTVDKQSITNNELGFYYQHILPEIERLHSLGYQLPSKDDLAAANGLADHVTTLDTSSSNTTAALNTLTQTTA